MDFGQLHHLEYYVEDLKKSNEFWDWFMPFLGYTKSAEWGSGVSWKQKNGTYICFVELEEASKREVNSRQGVGLNHVAFMGGSMAELDQLEKDLIKKNINILKRDGEYLCFEDVNLFAIEVYAKA
ncbi:MAG: hypothetical protein AB8E15_13275 [Bdellovibrionales bacterium]